MNKGIVFRVLLTIAVVLAPTLSEARWMNPKTGRFWTMDSYEGKEEEPRSLHKYTYANADPVNRIDPSGEEGVAAQTLTIGGISTLASVNLSALASAKGIAATLSLAIAAGASLSGSTEAAQEQMAIHEAEVALATASTSVAQEIVKARKIWRQNRGPNVPKFVPIPQSVIPDVADNVAIAQATRPQFAFLTRAPIGQAAKNRYQVLRGRGSAGFGMSWDEYPFASSKEGGNPFTARVVPVPFRQNLVQGGIIAGSYLLESIKPNDRYVVIVTP